MLKDWKEYLHRSLATTKLSASFISKLATHWQHRYANLWVVSTLTLKSKNYIKKQAYLFSFREHHKDFVIPKSVAMWSAPKTNILNLKFHTKKKQEWSLKQKSSVKVFVLLFTLVNWILDSCDFNQINSAWTHRTTVSC